MSYVKITNGTVAKYPYTVGQLRHDNPNVSFPRNISLEVMRRYGMYPVTIEETPDYNITTQKVVTATTPTRETNGVYTEENAPLSEMVGEPIYTGRWVITKSVETMTDDEVTERNTEVAATNRRLRDRKLAETDFYALSDVTMSAEMTTYRQALRDITTHANWPNLEDADWPTKP